LGECEVPDSANLILVPFFGKFAQMTESRIGKRFFASPSCQIFAMIFSL